MISSGNVGFFSWTNVATRSIYLHVATIIIIIIIVVMATTVVPHPDATNAAASATLSECNKAGQQITAAMIAPLHRMKGADGRVFDYVNNFTSIFADIGGPKNMTYWAPIMAAACFSNDPTFDKGHGSNLAHREVWDHFYRSRRPCGVEQRDILMVFEYDAFVGFPEAPQETLRYLRQNFTDDFTYLGYCHRAREDPRRSNKAPYCLHAYAMTLNGAKGLLDLCDPCGPFFDAQVAGLCDDKKINWTFAAHHYDRHFLDQWFMGQGIHLSGTLTYGGLFVQAKYDDEPHFPEGTLGFDVTSSGRKRYCLYKGTWKLIASFDDLAMLQDNLFEGKNKVKGLSHYQFHKYPVIDEPLLSAEDIQHLLTTAKGGPDNHQPSRS